MKVLHPSQQFHYYKSQQPHFALATTVCSSSAPKPTSVFPTILILQAKFCKQASEMFFFEKCWQRATEFICSMSSVCEPSAQVSWNVYSQLRTSVEYLNKDINVFHLVKWCMKDGFWKVRSRKYMRMQECILSNNGPAEDEAIRCCYKSTIFLKIYLLLTFCLKPKTFVPKLKHCIGRYSLSIQD